MTSTFSIRRRVQFSETDLAGIVHFSNFFRYMEEVEHAFYRSLGLTVHGMEGDETGSIVGFPRVHASADYRKPLRFEEEFEIELLVKEVRPRTMEHVIAFWKLSEAGDRGELAATGRLVVVCVTKDEAAGGMRAVKIPDRLASKLKPAASELIDNIAAGKGVTP